MRVTDNHSTVTSAKESDVSLAWVVYLLGCADGSYYTGITTNLERRLRQHNGELAGGARYTRVRRPVQAVWMTTQDCRSEAQRLEARLKKLSRHEKNALVAGQEVPSLGCLTAEFREPAR